MSTEAETDYSRCTFTTKEGLDGEPWIMVELDAPGIPALRDGFLGLTFRERVPIEEADRIARELRIYFEGISHTRFGRKQK